MAVRTRTVDAEKPIDGAHQLRGVDVEPERPAPQESAVLQRLLSPAWTGDDPERLRFAGEVRTAIERVFGDGDGGEYALSSIEQIFGLNEMGLASLDGGEDVEVWHSIEHVDEPFLAVSIALHPSRILSSPIPVFGAIRGFSLLEGDDGGSQIVVTTSSMRVIATAWHHQYLGLLPQRFILRAAATATARGYFPLRLDRWAARGR